MHKARVEIAETLPKVDLLIEVLDARIPFSSENPLLAELRGDKPCLKVLAKSDLADRSRTSEWQSHLEQKRSVRARAITTEEPGRMQQLKSVCGQLVPEKAKNERTITAMIVGIPNVGKSTLINTLAGRKVAKTGNEPAVTRGQQKIHIGANIMLLDTPGMMWPKVANPNSGMRLAATGAIRDTAMEYEDAAHFAIGFMMEAYFQRLQDRYDIEECPETALELMDLIGKRRGCLSKRGIIDYERVARIFLNDFRGGILGGITMETPAMMEAELEALPAILEAQEKKKEEKSKKRKAKFKANQASRNENGVNKPDSSP
jgi:ribosome biogenesis GTPase A